jgi:hypothetical protein
MATWRSHTLTRAIGVRGLFELGRLTLTHLAARTSSATLIHRSII